MLTQAPRTVWVKAGAGRGSGAAGGGARVQEERLFPKLEHRKRHLNQVRGGGRAAGKQEKAACGPRIVEGESGRH